MHKTLELPQSLYDQAERAARLQGVSLAEFITGALEEKLRAAGPAGRKQRVELPLVPSAHPGTRTITGERVAELLSEDDLAR